MKFEPRDQAGNDSLRFENLSDKMDKLDEILEPYAQRLEEVKMQQNFAVIQEALEAGATRDQLGALSEALAKSNLGIAADLLAEIRASVRPVGTPVSPQPAVAPVESADPYAGLSLSELVASNAPQDVKRGRLDDRWQELDREGRRLEFESKGGIVDDAARQAKIESLRSQSVALNQEFAEAKALGDQPGMRRIQDKRWAVLDQWQKVERLPSQSSSGDPTNR